MVRFVLLGCAAAALSGPVCAGELDAEAPIAASDQKVEAPHAKRRFTHFVALLPPSRPALEEVSATAPAGQDPVEPAQAGPIEIAPDAAPGKPAVFTILPPLRPSLPNEAAPSPAQADEMELAASATGPLPPPRPEIEDTAELTVLAVLPPERPAFPWDDAMLQAAAAAEPQTDPSESRSLFGNLFQPAIPAPDLGLPVLPSFAGTGRAALEAKIAYYAKLNDVPAELVHRVVIRESKYNPRAVGRGGALGLMQIKHATARALGYDGPASGLLDAETNLTYAVKYLAGAYRVAGGDFDRAVRNYARGYYYEAKRQRARGALGHRHDRLRREANASVAIEASSGAERAPQ